MGKRSVMNPDIIPLFIQISRFNFSKTSLDKAEVDRDIINDDTDDATVENTSGMLPNITLSNSERKKIFKNLWTSLVSHSGHFYVPIREKTAVCLMGSGMQS